MADKKVLCFEFGSQKIRICEVDYMKKNPHVYRCVTLDTPEGAVEDGYIKDKNILASAVKSKLAEMSIKNKNVVFTIASTKIANREVMIPQVKPNMIQSVIDVSSMDYFPVDISEYTISYKVLEKMNGKDEKKLRLLLLAAPNYLIKNYHEFAEQMNYEIESLDYAGNSTFQLMKKQVSEGVSLIVQISEQTSLINIIDNEMLILQRTIPFGSSTVLNTIIDSEYFDITTEKEAFKLLMKEELVNGNLNASAEDSALSLAEDHETYDKLLRELKQKEEVTNSIKYLVNNVNRVVDYYNSKYPERKINLVYLTGTGAKFKGMETLFQNEVGIELRKIENLYSVVFGNKTNVSAKDQAEYLSCIGASVEPVGFVMRSFLEKQQKKSSAISMGVILGASIFTSVVICGIGITGYQLSKLKKNDMSANITQLQSINTVFAKYDTEKANYDKLTNMDHLTKNRNSLLNVFVKELESKMPVNMMATSMISDTAKVQFSLEASNKEAIAMLLLQLKTFDSITGVEASGISQAEDDNGIISATCSVTCSYAPMVASADKEGENKDAQ